MHNVDSDRNKPAEFDLKKSDVWKTENAMLNFDCMHIFRIRQRFYNYI